MRAAAEEFKFHLSGGRLCLDFANTVSWRSSARPAERLRSYIDLVSWSRQAGLVTAGEARRLGRGAARRSAEAARVLKRAVEGREAIYRIFSRIADGLPPAPADIARLNAQVSGALRRLGVVLKGGGFSWEWKGDPDSLDRMLWPVARSAADLLTSGGLGRLRKCGADNCGWIFLDTTRNRSRRWCDMRVCGNRAKARRHYRRTKGT